MRLKYFVIALAITILLLVNAVVASAQVGQLRGSVKLVGADGQPAPVGGAVIDVFRTDLAAEYHTKSDKKGEWVFAGLPFVGTYIVSVSAPGAQPNAKGNVKAGREIPVDVVLLPGDGKRLTLEEAKAAIAAGSPAGSSGTESAADKAKREELLNKNKEIAESNKKVENVNKIITDAYLAGNTAYAAKNYDEAIKQYDIGIAADPEHPGIPDVLINKAQALKARGVDRYNEALKVKETDARTAALENAKTDFKASAEAANKAATQLKALPPATDPAAQKNQTQRLYSALAVRAEANRLFVTKVDPSQAEAGAAAFDDYIAVETDPAKKSKAQMDKAQMLFDAGSSDKAIVEFKKILETQADNVDALYGMGIAEISIGYANSDKVKLQEGVNYLQQFVDKAPDTHRFKSEAKATLAELKSTENVVPEKTTRPARKRP